MTLKSSICFLNNVLTWKSDVCSYAWLKAAYQHPHKKISTFLPTKEKHHASSYRIPSNKTNRIFLASSSKRLELLRNQLPSDALLLLLCKSGGGKKRFGYGAALVALTLPFDDEKHPVPAQPDSIEDDDVDAPLLMPFVRDAFSFNDLEFPLVDGPWLGCVGGTSSTINSDLSS